MSDAVTIVFKIQKRNFMADIEVPLTITANELVMALNTAYNLEIDVFDVKQCYMKAEYPIALLKGNRTLKEFGVRNGTVVYFTE